MVKDLYKKLFRISKVLLFVTLFVVLADAVTTHIGLSGDGFVETFPAVAWLIGVFGLSFGMICLVLINLVLILCVYCFIVIAEKVLDKHKSTVVCRNIVGFTFLSMVTASLLFKAYYVILNILWLTGVF